MPIPLPHPQAQISMIFPLRTEQVVRAKGGPHTSAVLVGLRDHSCIMTYAANLLRFLSHFPYRKKA